MNEERPIEGTNLVFYDHEYEGKCDGCGGGIPAGKTHVAGIQSCCGAGCWRILCLKCAKAVGEAAEKELR